jgi:hypothetical protein
MVWPVGNLHKNWEYEVVTHGLTASEEEVYRYMKNLGKHSYRVLLHSEKARVESRIVRIREMQSGSSSLDNGGELFTATIKEMPVWEGVPESEIWAREVVFSCPFVGSNIDAALDRRDIDLFKVEEQVKLAMDAEETTEVLNKWLELVLAKLGKAAKSA